MTEKAPIAIAHDYLTQKGGAERVILALHRIWPDAPIYTTFYDPEGTFPEFKDATIITSPLSRVAALRKDPRRALPLLPFISSAVHVKADKAVVSTSGWAHGFRYDGPTLVYCHTPARWVYLLDDYLGEDGQKSFKGRVARALRPALKRWDAAAVKKRTKYVANSTVVKKRIEDVYGMTDVDLVFPPHSVSTEGPQDPIPGAEHIAEEGYLLSVARLMPYKHVDVAIQAAERAGQNLLVIGKGPEEARLRAIAGENVVFAQDLTDAQLRWAYAHAKALIAASHEDFGITPLEASAWGVPTVALKAGGYMDTIVEGVNGVFVDTPTEDAVARGMEWVLRRRWDRAAMQAQAARFSKNEFRQRVLALLEACANS
ncbi:glycosyltransferase [Micrococcus luteus]|uniref:glycosyltransferase n=1 Tax=Micrococcus sp. KRD153 TaxID=2729724 RepID=UPI0019CFAC2F|nr:glycosyltransferase [Micrococcus sp. KRD153]MCV7455662.1 glycosyltransferase [Micrococcus luteus]MCV7555583.1 glycosyltransferase [Micrococcus luteus]MDN5692190.1 glycosyltransferase [Micrococcaceae bacterium]